MRNKNSFCLKRRWKQNKKRLIEWTNLNVTIGIFAPDFLGKTVEFVVAAKPDVFNHDVETVPRLYAQVRPKARYFG